MTRLRSLIKEVLTVKPKEDCGCGCNDCDGKAPIITEGRIKKAISEGLTYHVENKIPLHESVYRIGSEKHFELINEARKLWVRGLIDVSEDDQAILETHLGSFGMYEGEEVPLDMPMVNEVDRYSGFIRNPEDPDSVLFEPTGSVAQFKEDLRALFGKFKGDLKNPEFIKGVAEIMVNWKSLLRSQLDEVEIGDTVKIDKNYGGGRGIVDDKVGGYIIINGKSYHESDVKVIKPVEEAKKKKKKKKKDPPIGKPKRGGSKAYYVYVRDPKTKKIKKVSFGSGGLRAKIKNAEARKRFAARHNCKNKKDRTTAGYWSCNLPRYADQLGLGSKMNTFW